WLITGSYDGAVRIWDLHAVHPNATSVVLRVNADGVTGVAIDAKERCIVTASADGTMRFWDLQPKQLLDKARAAGGRNLTFEEWDLACPNLPYWNAFTDLPTERDLVDAGLDRAHEIRGGNAGEGQAQGRQRLIEERKLEQREVTQRLWTQYILQLIYY